ncbi:MAG: recombination protein RecR [Candidatus Marinimicrobia bacterium]|jgi:recombination protein RecR|nr:recombination protein RecR [Candidatus Neomarinimicrobiota bacterium]MBT3618278.1 recombination protein RecR [Candidatus Neomarinimicrobiota bacterium]MBT3828223.1 recombination protein RecR [Candidatus Neomarinimicrobiota bacterium]MBT3997140.1 recombination protein RecR [Candidatus Neomarinimicrobiota bacterium]MBT4280606.1 recombination protein RecR [Candidatus Neomarinimicrobiota bacterium]
MAVPDTIDRLIEQFAKFPGIGKKTAERMSFYLLNAPKEQSIHLAEAVLDMKQSILACSICGSITQEDPCTLCSDPKRDDHLICVVEDADDIYRLEKSSITMGRYHVLGGLLSPLDGIGPDDLNIDSLLIRVKEGMEIVLATNPSIEGEATNLYLAKLLKQKGVTVSRLARGLSVGSDLEYTDDATILSAMEGRTSL